MVAPELAIVGAGPAGLAAARVAGEAGVTTLLLDEYRQLGGQYFRQPEARAARAHPARVQREGARIIEQVRATMPSIETETVAYAIDDGRLFTIRGGRSHELHCALILATGATERVVPVPGWTLPGVVTCGGAQALIKGQGIVPGARILVAGSGPFLLPVASALIEGGARVVAVLEAQPFRPDLVISLARSLSRLREAAGYLTIMARARVPFIPGHGIVRIEGREAVSGAVIAPLAADGTPRNHQRRRFEVDAVAISDGFIPSIELAELAGAEIRYRDQTRTYAVEARSENGATSVPSLWAAGACVNELGGAQLAAEMGSLAGLAAVETLRGALSTRQSSERHRALERREQHESFARRLAAAYPIRAGWYQRTTDETIVCRCEDVQAGDIRAAVRTGADVNLVKRWTRAGMGLCQGRTCQSAVIELVAQGTGLSVREAGRFRVRAPIRPILLSAFAESTNRNFEQEKP